MNKTFIIAELSANHKNDFNIIVKTLESMAQAGADAVKIQTYTADSLALDVDNEYFGPKKEGLWKGIRPYDLYKEGAMPYEWQPEIKRIAENLGLIFFSSPFDFRGVDFLETLNVSLYKIASFEINDIPLIEYTAGKGKPMMMSTGLADEDDILEAIDACRRVGNNDLTLLKCTSQYPAKIEDANLRTIPDMRERFGVKVGLSDHTMGSIIPTVAVSLGATVVEKHFILDRALGGLDAAFSMEPEEFKDMVHKIRMVEASLGEVSYNISENDKLKRRSLFVTKDIKKGEVLSSDNIKSLRPGHSISPKYYNMIIGKRVMKNLQRGDSISIDDIFKE